jgi:hypothetical protein
MTRRLSARLARLEASAAQDKKSRSIVLRIGEAVPRNFSEHARVIRLPRKATSAELWMNDCAMRSRKG